MRCGEASEAVNLFSGAPLRESRDGRGAIVFGFCKFSKSEFCKFLKIENAKIAR
jgi:hypothetical protein